MPTKGKGAAKRRGAYQQGTSNEGCEAFEPEGLTSGHGAADDYEGVDYTHPVNNNAPQLDMGTPPGGRKRYNAPEEQ